jgi:uracil DNA glycosylase superfamily protein
MAHSFDPGPVHEPFATLCREYPGPDVYPPDLFRVEWGPIFHRGRLDGSARVLVIGQDPAQHEGICRRILVGEAGQRVQAFLAKLGIERSYVMINAFLYSVYSHDATDLLNHDEILAYRQRWLDALLLDSGVEAVIAFGSLARRALNRWRTERGSDIPFAAVKHPTFPEGSGGGAVAMRQLLVDWNAALADLRAAISHPDVERPLVPYDVDRRAETKAIPEFDLPAGLPPWMRSLRVWADRPPATDAETKRATITVTVPPGERPWRTN